MQYILDAWFLVRLLEEDPQAKQWLQALLERGKETALFPTVCAAETARVGLRHGFGRDRVERFLGWLYALPSVASNAHPLGIPREVAKEAGKLGARYGIGIADLVVLASAKRFRAAIKTAPGGDVALIARKEGIRVG